MWLPEHTPALPCPALLCWRCTSLPALPPARLPSNLLPARLGPRPARRVPEECPAEVKELIVRCLAVDPAARPGMEDVIRTLQARAGNCLSGSAGLKGLLGMPPPEAQTLLWPIRALCLRCCEVIAIAYGSPCVSLGSWPGCVHPPPHMHPPARPPTTTLAPQAVSGSGGPSSASGSGSGSGVGVLEEGTSGEGSGWGRSAGAAAHWSGRACWRGRAGPRRCAGGRRPGSWPSRLVCSGPT